MEESTVKAVETALSPATAPLPDPAQKLYQNKALTAMVLGITALVIAFAPLLGFIGLVLGIVATVLAANAKKFAAAHAIPVSAKNTAGLVCGVIAICIGALALLLFIVVAALSFFLIGTVDMPEIANGIAPYISSLPLS